MDAHPNIRPLTSRLARIRKGRTVFGVASSFALAVALLFRRIFPDPASVPTVTVFVAFGVLAAIGLVFVIRLEREEKRVRLALRADPRFIVAEQEYHRARERSVVVRFDTALAMLVQQGVSPEDARIGLATLVR